MKVKVSPFKLGSPKTPSPMKEMSWCLSKHIKVNIDPETYIDEKGHHRMTMRYQVIVSQGNRTHKSGYIYTKDNVTDAVFDAYRRVYNKNYGKKTKEQGDNR